MDGIALNLGKDRSQRVVGSVRLHDKRSPGFPLRERRSGSERLFQGVKCFLTFRRLFPRSVFPGKARERNDNVGIVRNETPVKVSKSQEGLDVLHFTRNRPVKNYLNFVFRHPETGRGKHVSEVLHGIGVVR